MTDKQALFRRIVETTAMRIIEHTDQLTILDQAIGDGDHGLNMKRGFEEILAKLDEITEKPIPDALKTAGMTLVMKVGGASGPLYGTLFMSLGKELAGREISGQAVTVAFASAIEAVMARGKSQPGQKTMLDVLAPLHQAMASEGADDWAKLRQVAAEAAQKTIPMKATKGRASFLGERSIGHMDPGARSSELIVEAVCDVMEKS